MSEYIEVNRDELIEILKSRIVEVRFEKTNGEERVMQCTLREDHLPPKNDSIKKYKPNTKVIAAYDVDKKGWRSFRVDRIIDLGVV